MKPLIIGIDPGTTAGYAAMDLNGNLIALDSSKNMGIDKVISKIAGLGDVVLVGTDIEKAPNFVAKFAAKLGARLFIPDKTMQFMRKKKITKEFLKDKGLRNKIKLKNKHEIDALAAAVSAYRHFMPLFNKIDQHMKGIGMEERSEQVKKIIIEDSLPIGKAIAKL